MEFDHINISAPMPMLEQVRDFYSAVFGLVDGFRPAFSRRGYWLYADERPVVHLIESDQHHSSDKLPYLDHIAFRLNGLASFVSRLKSLEVEYRSSWLDEKNMTQMFLSDPAGTGLEVNFIDEKLP